MAHHAPCSAITHHNYTNKDLCTKALLLLPNDVRLKKYSIVKNRRINPIFKPYIGVAQAHKRWNNRSLTSSLSNLGSLKLYQPCSNNALNINTGGHALLPRCLNGCHQEGARWLPNPSVHQYHQFFQRFMFICKSVD
jgi:hypothetical protein